MIRNLILFSLVMWTGVSSLAAVKDATIVEGSASKFEITAGTTSGAASTYTIFGGYAGPTGECASTTGSTCNSCVGAGAPSAICGNTGPFACAERSIYPALKLGINIVLDAIPTNPAIRVEMGSTTTSIPFDTAASSTTFAANQTFTVYIPWSTICGRGTPGSDCTSSITSDLTVGLVDSTASSATFGSGNSQKFTVKMRYANPAAETANAISDAPTASQGVTDFSVFPGDGKVFINDLWRGSFAPSDESGVRWQALRVFYSTYDAIAAYPEYCTIPVDTAGYADLNFDDKTQAVTKLGQSSIDGLTNDVDYMFTIATVDEATIVSQFLKIEPPGGEEEAYELKYAARPGEVVGLLDQKKCFIATAAFGSPMEPQVKLLRSFRDRVLARFDLGKGFIKFYYKNSPPLAAFIAEHDSLRALVRAALWPVILFADISLQWGASIAFLIYALILSGLVIFVKRSRNRRNA